jgi:hypothetical protein
VKPLAGCRRGRATDPEAISSLHAVNVRAGASHLLDTYECKKRAVPSAGHSPSGSARLSMARRNHGCAPVTVARRGPRRRAVARTAADAVCCAAGGARRDASVNGR